MLIPLILVFAEILPSNRIKDSEFNQASDGDYLLFSRRVLKQNRLIGYLSVNMDQIDSKQQSVNTIDTALSIMYIVIFALSLVACLNAQSCCANPSVCPQNSQCLCEQNVDTCMFQVTQEQQTFNLTNTQISYYYWEPTTQNYINIFLYLCPQSIPNSLYFFGLYVEDDNGTGYPTNLTTNFTSVNNNSCLMYSVQVDQFCKVPNGTYCQLRLAVQLQTPSASELSIFINSIEGTTKFIMPVLVSIGVLLVVIIIVLVFCAIKRRLLAQRNALNKVDNDINHFQEMLPKLSLQQTIRINGLPTGEIFNCSVCLFDLQPIDSVRRTPCGHIFHTDCIDIWCKKNLSCPMCRQILQQQYLKKKAQDQNSVLVFDSIDSNRKIEPQIKKETVQNIEMGIKDSFINNDML